MNGDDRLTLLAAQNAVTGIDFIEVVDPSDQHVLRVFFVVDPPALATPFAAPTDIAVSIVPEPAAPGEQVQISALAWANDASTHGRTVLQITVNKPGDFRRYRMTLGDTQTPSRFDRFFNGVQFSFKQGCPSVFDCRPSEDCPPENRSDFPVDYLARDFVSLRNALLDFSAQRYPLWKERIPADSGVMVAEILAALGDELAYTQDRAAREAHIDTASERRSLRRHATLIDYPLDDGASAQTCLKVEVDPAVDHGDVTSGMRVWAAPEGEAPVPFEAGAPLSRRDGSAPTIFVKARWNRVAAYIPDPGETCLPAGATEIYVPGTFPLAGDFVPPLLSDAAACAAWIGKQVLVAVDPADSSKPLERQIVTLTAIEHLTDPLQGNQPITRLAWNEPLAFSLCLEDASVACNIVPASAGETCQALFAIGDTDMLAPALRLQVPVAIEREGPQPLPVDDRREDDPTAEAIEEAEEGLAGARPVIKFLPLTKKPLDGRTWPQGQDLSDTESDGLGFIDGQPEIVVVEADANGNAKPDSTWRWRPSLLRSLSGDDDFTLDDGIYRDIVKFPTPDGEVRHMDRASAKGFSVRFGDGVFGRDPPDGTAFLVTYRTHMGTRANVSADSVTTLSPPPGVIAPPASQLLGSIASAVTNPLAVTSARDPMPLDTIRKLAPDACKADPLFAVRDEDYRAILERIPTIQQAGARARWTGSWLTEFTALDELGRYGLDADTRSIAEAVLDEVRQAGRPAFVMDPDYLPIDLRIRICVVSGFYAGQVIEDIYRALMGPTQPWEPLPYFTPDRFTFGTPLERAGIEAAVQSVPGTLGVEEIQIRIRGLFDWQDFAAFSFDPGSSRIIQIENDPDHPEAGSLLVTDKEFAA